MGFKACGSCGYKISVVKRYLHTVDQRLEGTWKKVNTERSAKNGASKEFFQFHPLPLAGKMMKKYEFRFGHASDLVSSPSGKKW